VDGKDRLVQNGEGLKRKGNGNVKNSGEMPVRMLKASPRYERRGGDGGGEEGISNLKFEISGATGGAAGLTAARVLRRCQNHHA
jgi:hypothetical protein